MKTPREIWRSERDDPVAWVCWLGGALALCLVLLMAQVAVWLNEPVGLRSLAHDCSKPYKDPRCVRPEDVQ